MYNSKYIYILDIRPISYIAIILLVKKYDPDKYS